MLYGIAGTTEMNHLEAIKSIESLWDACDEREEPFELLADPSCVDTETVKALVKWLEGLGEGDDSFYLPVADSTKEFMTTLAEGGAILALCGEEPDDDTYTLITNALDDGITLYDLAGQMVEIQFDDTPPAEVPAEETGEPKTMISSGWDDPESPPVAAENEPEPVAEEKRESEASILAGVTEVDLERMGAAGLKALVERLGLDTDKRSNGKMIMAIMDLVIALDRKGRDSDEPATEPEFQSVLDPEEVDRLLAPLPDTPYEEGDGGPVAHIAIVEIIYEDGSVRRAVVDNDKASKLAGFNQ